MTGVAVAADDSQLERALIAAVESSGGRPVPLDAEPTALVAAIAPGALAAALAAAPSIRWVQLGAAGIDGYTAAGVIDPGLIWTSAKGAYARPVAEHAMALTLSALRHFPARARATAWADQSGRSLHGLHVVVIGGGGIGAEVVRLLSVFDVRVTVVRRALHEVPGADRVVGFDVLDDVLPDADVVIVAAALTSETLGMFDERRLRLLKSSAVLVNVARGALIDTDALVAVLDAGLLGAVGLDVTDPEPLPTGHPLWNDDRVLITPHTADTPAMIRVMLAERVAQNVRRWRLDEPLIGLVDPARGY